MGIRIDSSVTVFESSVKWQKLYKCSTFNTYH